MYNNLMPNSRPVSTPKVVLDPLFDIPLDVNEAEYSDSEITVNFDESEGSDFSLGTDQPGVPTNLVISKQTIRTTKAGNQVVDVVLSFDSVENAVDYEVRYVKR